VGWGKAVALDVCVAAGDGATGGGVTFAGVGGVDGARVGDAGAAGVAGAGVAERGVAVVTGVTGAGVVWVDGGWRVQAKPMTASETVKMIHGAIAERGDRRRDFFLLDTAGRFAPSRAHHCFSR
jgi:hypothetical protein